MRGLQVVLRTHLKFVVVTDIENDQGLPSGKEGDAMDWEFGSSR